jgi:hypothetical protein
MSTPRTENAARVLTEILSITETANNEAIVVFNDAVLATGADRDKVLDAISVIGRNTLLKDARQAPECQMIKHSVDPQHEGVYMELRFMVNENNDLTTLVYFGSLAERDTPVSYALVHAAQVLDVVVKTELSG